MAKIKFLPAEKRLIKTQIGANIGIEMLYQLPTLTPLTKELGFQVFYLNNYSGALSDIDAMTVNTFLTETKSKIALHYLIQSKEIADRFPAYFDLLLSKFPNPEFIQLDNETIQVTKGSGVSMTNADYIARSQRLLAYKPTLKYSWDAGRMYRDTPNSPTDARNDIIAIQPAPPVWARQYRQIGDRVKVAGTPFTANNAANLTILNSYFDTLLPADDAQFKARFPNLTGQPILQFFVEDNVAGQKIAGRPLGNYAIGRMAEYVLKNTEIYPFLGWFQLTNLFPHGLPDTEYFSLKRIIPAFKFRYYVPLEIKIDGVSGGGVYDGVDSWGMILNNQTSTETKLLASDIKIFEKNITGIFVRDSGWARTFDDAAPTSEVVADIATLIKSNSVNFITFKTVGVS